MLSPREQDANNASSIDISGGGAMMGESSRCHADDAHDDHDDLLLVGREIPIIDLDNPDRSQLIDQLHRACSTWGFFQLINHGIPSQLLASFRQAMCDFFALPYDVKLGLKRHAKNSRGYFDDELTKRKRDWKEAVDVGVPGSRDWDLPDEDLSNACLDGYNRFPSGEDCPTFRDVVVEYFQECSKLSSRLATLMALSLSGQEIMNDEEVERFLDRMNGEHTSYLRMNHYPPCRTTGAELAKPPLGISPHRDAGFLTILLQDDDCHSLQVARFEDDDDIEEDEKWMTVHPIPGALTINTGDMAMICSNGIFRAPLHRVLTDPEKKRYSAPFFYNPGYNELISPFARCCKQAFSEACKASSDMDENNGSHKNDTVKYHPCLWGYFRALRFAGDLTDLGIEIQTSHYKIGSESRHSIRQKRFMELVNFNEPFDVEQYRCILVAEEDHQE